MSATNTPMMMTAIAGLTSDFVAVLLLRPCVPDLVACFCIVKPLHRTCCLNLASSDRYLLPGASCVAS